MTVVLSDGKEYYNSKEVIKVLNISLSTLSNWRGDTGRIRIPSKMVGRKMYYPVKGINNFFKKNTNNNLIIDEKYFLRQTLGYSSLWIDLIDKSVKVIKKEIELNSKKKVLNVLNELSEEQQEVIKMYYGLKPYKQCYTLDEISDYNKKGSRQRVGQIKDKAIEKMRLLLDKQKNN